MTAELDIDQVSCAVTAVVSVNGKSAFCLGVACCSPSEAPAGTLQMRTVHALTPVRECWSLSRVCRRKCG